MKRASRCALYLDVKKIYIACTVLLVACVAETGRGDEATEAETEQAAFTFPFPPPTPGGPQLTSITPTTGTTATAITVTGTGLNALRPPQPGFLPRYVVRLTGDPINGPHPSISISSDTSMTVTVAAGSVGGRIGVYDPLIQIDPFTGRRTQRLITSSSQSFLVTPHAPTMLTATPNVTSVQLAWRDNSDNETAFEISMFDTSWRVLGTVPANRTAEPITGLLPNTAYSFRIRAVIGTSAFSPFSNDASTTTLSNTGTLHLVSNAQYMATSIVIDGTEMIPGQHLPAHGATDFTLSNGAHSIVVTYGANTLFQSSLFTYSGNFTISGSQTTTFTVPPFVLSEIMTDFQASAVYFLVPALPPSNPQYTINRNGSWEWRQGAFTFPGVSLSATSWPDNALVIELLFSDGTPATYEVLNRRFVAHTLSGDEAYAR